MQRQCNATTELRFPLSTKACEILKQTHLSRDNFFPQLIIFPLI
ncbi:Uncharacterised protein [Bartonella grahamii]|uniref:Uncharacterized protein n=1 Tax=Bartonella grahamii TaxID=33045 RepID=A0A336NCH3_BARGR|nr:Uncharacterised protein [Bartonella grahamii]